MPARSPKSPKAIFFSSCLAEQTNCVTGPGPTSKAEYQGARPKGWTMGRERRITMHWRFTPYLFPVVIAAGISAGLAPFPWRGRLMGGIAPFLIPMLGGALGFLVD